MASSSLQSTSEMQSLSTPNTYIQTQTFTQPVFMDDDNRRPSLTTDERDPAPPTALAPAPDSRLEIKKLLRQRDEEAASDKDSECSRPMKALEEQAQRQKLLSASADHLPAADMSLVPDALPVQPLQEVPDARSAFLPKYNLYNPVGPRWYKNHHLIPPHTRTPLSSTFSPAFPPMRSALGATTSADVGRMPGPSRTPSGSPLPTPNASQTRLGDAFPRPRKISQTAHDNVDMLDATDPWGTNWHHQSPYDVGGLNNAPTQDPPQHRSNRSRTSSSTRHNGRLPNPSPLSQSTSAVHLAGPSPPATIPVRKRTLSKPVGGIRRFFSGSSTDDIAKRDAKAASAPATPVDSEMLGVSAESGTIRRKLSKRGRTAPPILSEEAVSSKLSVNTTAEKKEKRVSIMGRIGKKLSVLRRPIGEHHGHGHAERRSEELEHAKERHFTSSPTMIDHEPRKFSKRVPPPEPKEDLGHRSSASIDLEFPLTMGNLTIANPDQPSPGSASPIKRKSQLPSQDTTAPSPAQSVPPLPPPKRTPPPPPLPDEGFEEEGQPRTSTLRVTNTPDRESETLLSPTAPSPPDSPLLPPSRLFASGSSTLSPGVVSISLSTASFSSPPPPPEKNWEIVDPSTLTDSPIQQDIDLLPDIASEPDYEALASRVRPLSLAVLSAGADAADERASRAPMYTLLSHRLSTTDSPLSRASLFVNPPTPMAPPAAIPTVFLPEPLPAPTSAVPKQMQVVVSQSANDDAAADKERERAERATRRESRRESRREEKVIREERERALRHESRQEERASRHEEKSKLAERSKRDDKERSKHEERSKRESVDKERGSRKGKNDRTSTTETFRLVRTPSDNIRLLQGTAIPVGEEQWTVVEAPSSSKRRREKGKERSTHRGESKRSDKHESMRRHRHNSTSGSKEERHMSLSTTRAPVNNSDPHLRHQRSQSLDDRKLSDSQSSEKKRKSERRRGDSRQAGHSSDSRSSQTRTSDEHQRPSLSSSAALTGPAPLDRHASLRRAVSDLPAGADQMMSLSAREAWDAERMWKGKSAVFDHEGGAGVISGASAYDPRNSQYSAAGTIRSYASGMSGSGHTGYMVQGPFYEHAAHAPVAHQSSFYAFPVPVAPPPAMVFPAAYSPGRYDYPNSYRSYAESLSYNDAPGPLANPLPDPPRQSMYAPEPLLSSHTRQGAIDNSSNDPSTPEYWSMYAGIATH